MYHLICSKISPNQHINWLYFTWPLNKTINFLEVYNNIGKAFDILIALILHKNAYKEACDTYLKPDGTHSH